MTTRLDNQTSAIGPAAGSSELRDVLRRFFDLSTEDQLAGYEEIKQHLGSEAGVDTELDLAIEQKAEALSALQRVTAELRRRGELEANEAPTAKQFDDGAKALELDWRRGRVIRSFGSWRNAKRAVKGEKVREAPSQKRARARAVGRSRGHEEPVHSLRLWLESKPEHHRLVDYEAFAMEANRRRGQAAKPLPGGQAVRTSLRLPWASALEVARGERTMEQARGDRRVALEDLDDESLVGVSVLSLVLETREQHLHKVTNQPGFPRPVARLGHDRAWFFSDIKAYKEDKPVPARKEGSFQHEIVTVSGLARELGLHVDYVRKLLSDENWKRIPIPNGRVGRNYYWLRKRLKDRLPRAK
jgi:hypothetical protein